MADVQKVTRGWYRNREANTVIYHPDVISPEEMISALKKAGTYGGVAEE